MKTEFVIVDIDGTVADLRHRIHFIQGEKKDWDAFYSHAGEDSPIESVISVINSLAISGCQLVFVTGRPDRIYYPTVDWLEKVSPPTGTMIKKPLMFFRKNGDFRPDTVVKKEIYENKLKAVGITPENTVVFEDRSGVVYMWRTLGFTCFQVADGDY